MKLAEGSVGINERTKHIAVRYHYARECVENRVIRMEYCPSGEMLADVLTKALPRTSVETLRGHLHGVVFGTD